MNKNLIKVSTLNMSHNEWLAERRKSIGGSDAAAIIGLNHYASPYSVWAEKVFDLPEKEDNEAMRQGRDFEDYVAKRFTEATGKKVRRENYIIRNPQYPFAHATVDRMVIGEDAGLECKTTSVLNLKNFKNGEYPDNYYVQCVHYMMITGCNKWYLAVLVLGKGFMWFEIERDEEEIRALAQSEEAFWKLVESRMPPAVDGTEATGKTIQVVFPKSEAESEVVNLAGYDGELSLYMQLSSQIKALETQKKEVENKIKNCMQTAGRGEGSQFRVSWTSSERNTFNSKQFAEDYRQLDLSKYFKCSIVRTFKVTKLNA